MSDAPDEAYYDLLIELECLERRARKRYIENQHRPPWWEEEARWHIYKAIDQFCVASYHSRDEDSLELSMTNLADGLNHLLMAMAVADGERKGCHPVMDDA